MKKYIFLVIAVIIMFFVYINVNASCVVIPDSAIRVRVIGNSDSLNDINMKMMVTEYLEEYLAPLLVSADSVDAAREIISDNLVVIDDGIREIFLSNDYDMVYDVSFGLNYFPNKEYKGVKYNAGNYESLVVTIGSGGGDNWWCVLFPPLCLLDASDSEGDDVLYRLWIMEMLDKYF